MNLLPSTWSHHQAVGLCQDIENICPKYGYHVALTGGCLYKEAVPRKDVDIVFYSIRQLKPSRGALLKALEAELDFKIVGTYGWMNKAVVTGRNVDMFFPETSKRKKWFGITKAGEEY